MQALSQFSELWKRLDSRARLIVMVAGVLVGIGVVLLSRTQSGPVYTALYGNLSAEDAGAIVEKLKAGKVPYRLTNGGGTVEVPEERVYEQRITLAKEGLPSSGQVGFEIFDKSGLPGTEFSNRINYQRALQGELARTIGAMAEVRSARVHLVLPEETLFSDKTKPSASVVLQPKPGAELTPELTGAIAHVVASAVQDIKAEDVTIADSNGRLLKGPQSASTSGLTSNQFEIQQQYENRLCSSLQSMLDTAFGPNQSVVRIQAQLDFDAQEIKNENIVPVAGGKGLVSSEKVREEQYQSAQGPGGAPSGIQSNLGLVAGSATSSGRNGTYTNRDETRQYEYSRNTTSLVKAPGKIKTLTVAAIINEELPSAAEDQVRQLLTAAAGISQERGDVVTVQRMKIQAAEAAKNEEKELNAAETGQRRQALMRSGVRGGLMVVAAAMILFSVIIAARQFRPPIEAVAGRRTTVAPSEMSAVFAPAAGASLEEPAVSVDTTVGNTIELNPSIREQLRRIAAEDSESVADRIMALLHERQA